ncbi:hypothetical protein J2749_001041 [Methanobacterium oryzae]
MITEKITIKINVFRAINKLTHILIANMKNYNLFRLILYQLWGVFGIFWVVVLVMVSFLWNVEKLILVNFIQYK